MLDIITIITIEYIYNNIHVHIYFFFAIDSRFICIILYAYWHIIHSILHFLASSASFLKSKSVSQLCWGIDRDLFFYFFLVLKKRRPFGWLKSIHSPFSQISGSDGHMNLKFISHNSSKRMRWNVSYIPQSVYIICNIYPIYTIIYTFFKNILL